MRYSHIVFDIDGTILNTEYAILHSLRDTMAEMAGQSFALEELTFSLGIPGVDTLRRLAVEDIDGAMALWIEKMHAYEDHIALFPGIAALLPTLRENGVELGIVTSQTHEEFGHNFQDYHIQEHFGVIVCADDTQRHKPEPDPLLRYMELAGARTEDMLYVGDSVYDSRCAHAAGVDFALALWGTHDPDIPAQHRLDQPGTLLRL